MRTGFRKFLGVMALFIGVSILLWAGYNKFIERQADFREGPAGYIFAVAMIAAGIYSLRSRPSTTQQQWR